MKQKKKNKNNIYQNHKHQVPCEKGKSQIGENRVIFYIRIQIIIDFRIFADHLLGGPQDLVEHSRREAGLRFPVVATVREGKETNVSLGESL